MPRVSNPNGKHVFVSYVHEDSAQVDGLCAILEAAQIPYWRDRKSLGPGDAWKAKIREAIRSGSLVFLACFSEKSRAKDKSHMNEELTLAVEEYRKMPPGRTWLIPVRLDSGNLPEWDLGAGRVLSDLNYVDLFGPGHAAAAAALVTTIHGVMGQKQLSPAATLEAVGQATAADRVDLLKRLTKEMLLDPQRRIQLDDLISQEVQRVVAALTDSNDVAGPLAGSNEDQVVHIAEQAQQLWMQVTPFCASLQVAARWGSPEALSPWVSGIRSFVSAACKPTGGVQALIDLRHLPGMVSAMTAGLACVASRNWENLRVLLVDQSVRDRYQSTSVPLLEATHPYAPFGNTSDWVAPTLARAAKTESSLREALEAFTQKGQGKPHTPVAEWLHRILRPLFLDQLPDQDAYDSEFDRAEVMLGLLSTDAIDVRIAASAEGHRWGSSRWFGRSMWRSVHSYGNPVSDFVHELSTQGAIWGPLRASLFGGDEDRARAALEKYGKHFSEWANRMW